MNTAVSDDAWRPDWDKPGSLSIVLQGALFQGNMIETANHCRHWRDLFPHAEIILAISVTDVVYGSSKDGVVDDLRLVPRHCYDGHLQAARDIIVATCDRVAFAEKALPLPPIKSDSPKLNNMNFQLAAAKVGLRLATGHFVLRIRSDLLFMDRSFLDQYVEGERKPRGSSAVFERRVLISWLFTLNPFTVERMPLHFSDWFHFGLTEDVRRIWACPAVSFADSIYYRTNPHAPGSNAAERLFNTRLAVEQHVMLNCFKDLFPNLVVDYHNDQTSAELSLDILVDNFVICDLVAAQCIFEKYSQEFFHRDKQYHCITREDWLAMADARDVSHRTTLSSKIQRADDPPHFEQGAAFPRVFDAYRFDVKDGWLLNGELVASTRTGILSHGPYVTLGRGRYAAVVKATTLDGPGFLTLRVTRDAGGEVLAETKLKIGPTSAPALEVLFEVTSETASKVEVVCGMEGLRGLAISSVTLEKRAASVTVVPPTKLSRLRSALRGGNRKPSPIGRR